eukprot:2122507-Lingulodinium_polyedra.AAC.1
MVLAGIHATFRWRVRRWDALNGPRFMRGTLLHPFDGVVLPVALCLQREPNIVLLEIDVQHKNERSHPY